MLIELNEWAIKGKDWEQALIIYEKIFGSDFFLQIARKTKSSFSIDYINTALENKLDKAKDDIDVDLTIKPDSLRITPKGLPTELQELYYQRGELFRIVSSSRNMLKKLNPIECRGRVTIKEALDIMAATDRVGNLRPFSIHYYTCNLSTGEAGVLKYLQNAVLVSTNVSGNKKIFRKHNPNHWKNSTRNIRAIDSLEVTKINIWLIMSINGMEVTLKELG